MALAAITSLGRFGFSQDVDGYIYRNSGIAISTTPAFDVGSLNRMSVQVVYSSTTASAVSFTDGRKSTATITVGSNFALLQDATAYFTVKIASNSSGALSGAILTVNGYQLREGVHWSRQSTATGTATNLAAAIDLYTSFVSTNVLGASSTDTVRSSATVYGTAANSYTVTTSTPTALTINSSTSSASATFIGGRNQGFIGINGTLLYAGKDWAVGASTAATATNIAAAINANTTLSQIVVATAPLACSVGSCGVVKSTSITNGVNAYSLTTSTYGTLTPSGDSFGNGSAATMDSTTDKITVSNVFTLGLPVWAGASVPTGLTAGTTYFAIPVVQGTSFKLSDTSTGAIAGVVVDISTTAAGNGTYTLTPSTTTTGSSFLLQQSNDGSNWVTVPSTGTVTIGEPSGTASLIYDAGSFNFKYLRFNFTKPTRGAIATDIVIHGKQ